MSVLTMFSFELQRVTRSPLGVCITLLMIAAFGCGSEPTEVSATTEAVVPAWANGDFQQILRVNDGETKVRNRCELTIPLSGPKPLTFIGSEPMGWGTFPSSVGWTGGAVSVPSLSVTACPSYPCQLTAVYRGEWENGTGLRCQLVADDGTSRLVGTSTGSSLNVPAPPSAAVIARQSVRIGPSGTPIAGMCVLQQSADVPSAEVTDLAVFVNGAQVTTPISGIAVGAFPWATLGPDVGFGTVYVGVDAGLTRLKHVTARKEQLAEGDGLRCAGTYHSAPGTPVFDLNVSRAAEGVGLSLVTDATGWTCSASAFGAGDGCDCHCGVVDPDCAPAECAPSSTPRDDFWVTDRIVNAVAVGDGVVYIGGDFNYVGPPTGGLAIVDGATGAAARPRVNGTVHAVAPDGSGGWYIGGEFADIDGIPRNRLAHILANGAPDPIFNPNANDAVYSIVVVGATIYVGGAFTSVGGQARNRLAALSASTGAVLSWNPNANASVRSLAMSGSTLYVGGDFGNIGGQTRLHLAALDASTGAVLAWNPGASDSVHSIVMSGSTIVIVGGAFTLIGGAGQVRNRIASLNASTGAVTAWNPGANGTVRALAVNSTTVYAGGDFTNIGGQGRSYIAALGSTGAATSWTANASGVVYSLALNGSTVYAGGNFTYIGGVERHRLAALDANTGTVTSWNPKTNSTVLSLALSGPTVCAGGSFSSVGGELRTGVAALDATTGALTSWNPNANWMVRSLAVSGTTIYVGGLFSSIGGQARNSIAALDADSGAATSWNPNADGVVNAIAVSGSTLYAGGSFTNIGGLARNRIAALDVNTGTATSWDPNANSDVDSLAVSGSTIYTAGYFTNIGGLARSRIAALDASTGAATSWNPGASALVDALAVVGSTVYAGGQFWSVGGLARNGIAAVEASTGMATSWNPIPDIRGVYSFAASGSTVYVAGGFSNIGGQARESIAGIDMSTGAATPWNPGVGQEWLSGGVVSLALSGPTVYAGGVLLDAGNYQRYTIAVFEP